MYLKGTEREIYKLSFFAKHPIADNKIINLTQRHFEILRDERLKYVKPGTIHADI